MFIYLYCNFKANSEGALRRPVPTAASKSKETRYLDIHEDEQFDETQFAARVKQASQLPSARI